MNTRGRTIDFSRDSDRAEITDWHHRHDFKLIPFAVLPDRNHATVIDPTEMGAASNTKAAVMRIAGVLSRANNEERWET